MTDNIATVTLSAISRIIASIEIDDLHKSLRNTFGL
jgi:hypothetical protein